MLPEKQIITLDGLNAHMNSGRKTGLQMGAYTIRVDDEKGHVVSVRVFARLDPDGTIWLHADRAVGAGRDNVKLEGD